ncbi:uncharacterized protein LOC129296901 [Prosopis cineraria]|uniref:uncharacterized protein LOC129296901 n=1 Tax=Prosopis cineraria TaxID=364024 RepID=UPI00240FA526|nr:uncharacterized protein LOC129296901 [Prosopis cineraria]
MDLEPPTLATEPNVQVNNPDPTPVVDTPSGSTPNIDSTPQTAVSLNNNDAFGVQRKLEDPNMPEEFVDNSECEVIALNPEPSKQAKKAGLKSVWLSKEAQYKAKLAIVKWLYMNCIPFNAVNCPYFLPALDAIAAIGPGFKGPSFEELKVNLLTDCRKECQLLIESHRATWKESGCTLMVEGWIDKRQRTLINFLVYSPISLVFVKSVDGSHIVKDAKNLFSLFCKVIEWVSPTNIVHVVTDNATNYVAAGKLIREKYNHIYWSPCVAHCLNLILKDIASMPHVADLATKASKIIVFVYNHMAFLSWLKRRDGWTEIVHPGATRTKVGQLVGDIVLDKKFWDDCHQIVCLVGPLIKLLRIVDVDEKPSLGYVYEAEEVTTPNPDFTIEKIQNEDFLGGNACPFGFGPELRENEGVVEDVNVLQSPILDSLNAIRVEGDVCDLQHDFGEFNLKDLYGN